MKVIYLAAIILLLSNILTAGEGSFKILAVCEIGLLDGNIVEGLIEIGTECSSTNYCNTNGICLLNEDGYSNTFLLNEIPPIYRNIASWAGDMSYLWDEDTQVYFLRDVSKNHYGQGDYKTFSVEYDTLGSKILMRRIIQKDFSSDYELLPYIPVYLDIPEDLSLEYFNTMEASHIEINKIEKFIIVNNPSEEWFQKFKNARVLIGKNCDMPILYIANIQKAALRRSFKPWNPRGY